MRTYNCVNCGNETAWSHQKVNKYCSLKCQHGYQTRLLVEDWLAGGAKSQWKYSIPAWAKAYLIETRTHRCECCNNIEWCEKPIPLEVDHISGDSTDNSLENLRLLCPNCHSQTPTYKSKNRKSSRVHRAKYNVHKRMPQ
jgi:Zn finger protein HypA/HybF involved in hydrogenase expression